MANTENRGKTAHEAVLEYCTYWTQAVYRDCWPKPDEVAPDATREMKKEARLAVARELMAMLRHKKPASASEPMEELAVLQITGDLGSDSEPEIKAGRFLGTYGVLDINTGGHWTYSASETRLKEIKENGPDWFTHYDRFFVTHEDGSVQTLTITLSRRRNDEVKETKAFPTVGDRVPAETFGENNEPDLRLATERDFTRKFPDPDQFDRPAPVPLWLAGQLDVNQPLVRLTFDDIRNTEFDIEENEVFGDGRKFVGLRFFNAAEGLSVDEMKGSDNAAADPKERRDTQAAEAASAPAKADQAQTDDEQIAKEPQSHKLTSEDRKRGGSRKRYNPGFQTFINQRSTEFTRSGKPFSLSAVKDWLHKNVRDGEPYQSGINDCDDIEFVENTLFWKDQNGRPHSLRVRSFERYIQRAKQR